MGCFDFTYCDNGSNTRGGSGYIYITNALKNLCNLPNPIKFTENDGYGRFKCLIDNNEYELDIFSLYAVELYLANLIPSELPTPEQYKFIQYISLLKKRDINTPFYDIEDFARIYGIEYFHKHIKEYKSISNTFEIVNIPSIGNQKAKHNIECCEYCNAEIPMMISKKKISSDKNDDAVSVAEKWGFVSNDDPEQDGAITKNYYTPYKKPTKNHFTTSKTKTRFDKITNNIDELCNFITDIISCDKCPCFLDCNNSPSCYQSIKNWLKKKVT